jgi:large subunit ribosomal protein L29
MKVDELRSLEVDELDGRLKAARRELYELRFKHAVGQLENSSQISKVRHDIARIMTVLRERDFGIAPQAYEEEVQGGGVALAEAPEAEPEAAEAEPAPKSKAKRARKAKAEEEAG